MRRTAIIARTRPTPSTQTKMAGLWSTTLPLTLGGEEFVLWIKHGAMLFSFSQPLCLLICSHICLVHISIACCSIHLLPSCVSASTVPSSSTLTRCCTWRMMTLQLWKEVNSPSTGLTGRPVTIQWEQFRRCRWSCSRSWKVGKLFLPCQIAFVLI